MSNSATSDCTRRDILSAPWIVLPAAALYPAIRNSGHSMMPATENMPRQLVLRSGSTTLTLDKDAGKATLQRKFLMWGLKPVEVPLAEVADVTVDATVDRASGVEICHTMLIMRSGEGWAFPAANKQDAQTKATAMRAFLGLAG